jgi:DNA polymerase-3 subunit epsilon
MNYLSFDIEATGLDENDYMIEFACVPFSTTDNKIYNEYSFHYFIKCPSFEELKPNLNEWVIKHNESLINKAHDTGLSIEDFKEKFTEYLNSKHIKQLFNDKKITLFGKSMAAIDLPFLNRDLSWDFMRTHFEHRQLDLSAIAYGLIDMSIIPKECESGSFLMNHLALGEVKHTALADAINTANMYLKLLDIVKTKLS